MAKEGQGRGFAASCEAAHGTARSSPWRVDGRPRRARREMAPRGETETLREKPGTGKGLVARRERSTRPAASASGVDGITGKTEKEME